jgi:hypothetical protein
MRQATALKSTLLLIGIFCVSAISFAQNWPEVTAECKPGTRWWWMGSAVDKTNLTYNLEEYARAGIGSVEITPVYGVQKNTANEISFLSAKWMEMLRHTISEAHRLGIQTDMNTGTGWPFGGPEVTIQDAASKLIIRQYQVKGGSVFNETIIPEEKQQQDVATLQRLMAYSGKKIFDLTKTVNKKGHVSWKAPKGEWVIIAAFNGKTFQKVKRAAPGGEGYVMNHLSAQAVENYLNRFTNAFESTKTPFPHHFFNDSYEVYGADWTADLFDQFVKRRGYKLENYLPVFLSKERNEESARIVTDYRETIAELLLENFSRQWTEWAHLHGSKTRNQAHGSPGNLIDLYANVDIPECEGFGLSAFGIKGLRTDSLTRKNDSELSMLKYASSAAHIAGKPYVSSETFTWLTEHFRTSLSQCKPDLDLMFVAGVNHMNFHGTTYSPREAAWPGWKFYASIDMSPTNSIWQDAPALTTYIARCQSFLQSGKPDNDFLIYLPVYDIWHEQGGRLLMFDIHSMDKKMPEFIKAVHAVYENGYDVDYTSDHFILSAQCIDGMIVTKSGSQYKALILPAVKKIPDNVAKHIEDLTAQGAQIIFLKNAPNDVPGFAKFQYRQTQLRKIMKRLIPAPSFDRTEIHAFQNGRVITGADFKTTLEAAGVQPEEMITRYGLHTIRRSNDKGFHYFISALHADDTNDWITLSVPAKSVQIFDPITGETGKALTRIQNGKTQVFIQLKSGQSLILKTYTTDDITVKPWPYLNEKVQILTLSNPWKLYFTQSEPQVKDTFRLNTLKYWTDLENPILRVNMGTGVYETTFNLNDKMSNCEYILQLGNVRESARVFVNEKTAATVWAAPFECRIGKFLNQGKNTLRIEVTNLPANRIADYDRHGVEWRMFNEINFVDRNYKKTEYGHWQTMESGLGAEVNIEVFKLK